MLLLFVFSFGCWLKIANARHSALDAEFRVNDLTQILPNIQRDDVFTHGLAEKVSGLESVSSMENCFVALTACGRFGGI